MKTKNIIVLAATMMATMVAEAQIGQPWIHDPSTLVECDGKYYTFGTGGGGLITEDGWTWKGGAERPGGGAAPDALKIGDRYLVVYGGTGGGLGGGHCGIIYIMWNKTLDPKSPDFKFSEPIEVVRSADLEDCDAIDPGLLLDPTTGRLWMSYGTYFGFIRMIELDPKTGRRVEGNKEKDVAIDCEATDLIYRNGWYYLLGTHGTCCDGVNLSLIHLSEPTRLLSSSYAVFCLKQKSVIDDLIHLTAHLHCIAELGNHQLVSFSEHDVILASRFCQGLVQVHCHGIGVAQVHLHLQQGVGLVDVVSFLILHGFLVHGYLCGTECTFTLKSFVGSHDACEACTLAVTYVCNTSRSLHEVAQSVVGACHGVLSCKVDAAGYRHIALLAVRGALAHYHHIVWLQTEGVIIAGQVLVNAETEGLCHLAVIFLGIGIIYTSEYIHLGQRCCIGQTTCLQDEVLHGGVIGKLIDSRVKNLSRAGQCLLVLHVHYAGNEEYVPLAQCDVGACAGNDSLQVH